MVTEFWRFSNCHAQHLGYRALQAAQRGLEPAGTGTVSGSCNSQFALFTTERLRELRPAVAFSKTCLKQVSMNLKQLLKVKLKLYFKFVMHYAGLLVCHIYFQ